MIKPQKQTLTLDGKKGRANLAERKIKTRTVHFNALKMKDDNLSDNKSSLQASLLVFFILSTKSY